MKKKLILPVMILFSICIQSKAQKNPNMYNTRPLTDTLNVDNVVYKFTKSRKTDGIYNLYTFSDGIKIKIEYKEGKIIKYQAVDENNNPIIPQTMMGRKGGGIKCWLAIKKGSEKHLIRIGCPDFGKWF